MPSNIEGIGLNGLNRAFTGTTLQDPNPNLSPESTPSMSDEDSEYRMPRPLSSNHREKLGSNQKRQFSAPASDRDLGNFPKFEDGVNDVTRSPHSQKSQLTAKESPMTINETPSANRSHDVAEVIANAMKELSKIRQREQSLRPLRVIRLDPDKRPDNMLSARFQKFADDELKIRRLNAKDWLRVATWWLLKVDYSSLI